MLRSFTVRVPVPVPVPVPADEVSPQLFSYQVFADTWDRVPLLKRVSAEERERLVKKIDIDGSDDEGAVTREGVDGAVVEIKHQTERMKRLLHRFKSDRHLRGDEQRSAAASKTKFKKAQTKSRVDFGKSGPPNAGLLQSELKACLAANEEVIDRAWAAKDEDALRAAMKTSEKLIGKLKRAEVQVRRRRRRRESAMPLS